MKIAIVGAHPGSRLGAPYDDPGTEIWSCSQRNENELPRTDRWFELHQRAAIDGNPPYIAFLATLPLVYMQQRFDDIPGSVPYPIDRMVKRFGREFFAGTVCYMAALAIAHDPEEIGLWGIEAGNAEYASLRLPLQHFIHVARREGIRVTCPDHLREGRLYGYL